MEGAAALRRTLTTAGWHSLLPPAGEFYACPCCLAGYDRNALVAGDLTYEHVPPRAAGGQVLALTCRACNNTAGTAFDADAERREARLDFYTGNGPGRPLRAEFMVDGVVTRGSIRRAGDTVYLAGAPKANNLKHLEEMNRTLEIRATQKLPGGRIGFRLTERTSLTHARLSWVRAAYLAAFAALGYWYVLMSYLDPLREQLANPTANLLPPLGMIDVSAPEDRRQLLVVQEPVKLRALAVTLGRHTVFLPWVKGAQPLEVLSGELARFGELPEPRPPFNGKQIPWPVEPCYLLDR